MPVAVSIESPPARAAARGNNGHEPSRVDRLRGMGAEIRALRQQRGLKLADLADEIGASTSLISQIERGITAPSLEVLWAISRAFGVPIGAFFQENGASDIQAMPLTPPTSPKAQVVRANARKRLALPNTVSYDLLSPDLKGQIEFTWAEFEPGNQSPLEPYTHAGEEQMVVIEGEIHFWVDGEEFVLHEGDSIRIDSSLPHRTANLSDKKAIVIAAMTPPSF
jgi:transcriptional regulator with XRE-family HTH domain